MNIQVSLALVHIVVSTLNALISLPLKFQLVSNHHTSNGQQLVSI